MKILNHSYNPLKTLEFLGSPRKDIYFGVELELEIKTSQLNIFGVERRELEEEVAEIVCSSNEGKGFLIPKYDGSLDFGIEFVSAPASLTIHQRRWPKLLSILKEHTIVRPTCGMHVHISRKIIPPEAQSRMHRFFNTNPTFIRSIAGREASIYNTFIKKSEGMELIPHGRYEAFNVSNPNTLEVRIFKSTLDPALFLARLEFVASLAHLGKDNFKLPKTSLKTTNDFEILRSYVYEREKSYPNFVNWLKNRKANTKETETA